MTKARLLAFVALALIAAVALVWAGVDAAPPSAADCDNLAGECLRGRQEAALYVLAACCAAAAAAAAWAAVGLVRRGWSLSRGVLIVFAAALAVAVMAVDPAAHLDDRFDGWLAFHGGAPPTGHPAVTGSPGIR